MAFFETKKKDLTANMQNLQEIYKTNTAISAEEKNLTSLYGQIGRAYAAAHSQDAEPELASMVAAVAEAQQKIAAYKDQLLELKGMRRCECGAEVPKDNAFCPACGKRVVQPKKAGGMKCPACGATAPEGTNFCPACGGRMVAQAPEKTCPFCGKPITGGNRFCTGCGRELPQTPAPQENVCPKCGEPVAPGALFCCKCGASMAQPAPVREAPPVQERTCSKCGKAVPEGMNFCTGCGTSMAAQEAPAVQEVPAVQEAPVASEPFAQVPAANLCPCCGAAVVPGNGFCTECGTRMPGAPAAPAAPAAPVDGICPNCGAALVPGNGFCTECGARL